MSKSFSLHYVHYYDMVKCHQNMNSEEMGIELQQEKMIDFDYCNDYLRSISSKILLWQC